jgi:hypothetical protein
MEVCNIIHGLGWIGDYHSVDGGNIVTTFIQPKNIVAKMASSLSGGTWLSTSSGVFQNLTGQRGWMMTEEQFEDVMESRAMCRKITNDEPGWSVASNARKCWLWALEENKAHCNAQFALEGAGIGHSLCEPGEHENAALWDISGAYANILMRLPSRKWYEPLPGKFREIPETKAEKVKLRHLQEFVWHNKKMRNSIWGSCLGTIDPSKVYVKGNQETRAPRAGTHQIAAVITGRICWELAHLGSIETGAYYSKTDSVICAPNREPKVWGHYGFSYEKQHQGKTHIQQPGAYKCGAKETKRYIREDTHTERVPIGATPDRLFVSEFLR